MSLIVVPTLRNDEEKSRSRLQCSKCRRELKTDPSQSRSNFCLSRIEDQVQGFLTFCRECYQKQTLKCICFNKECEDLAVKIVNSVKNFYLVPCSNDDSESTHFLIDSFIPLCRNCIGLCEPRERPALLSYSDVERAFFELLSRNSDFLCKDRLKLLISKSTRELLEDCRWLSQVDSGLFCREHKSIKAESINLNLEGLCRRCSSGQGCLSLSSVKDTVSAVVDVLRQKACQVDARCLNQFMIQVLKRSITLSSPRDLALLVLEGRSLLSEDQFKDVRCVECCNKISLGSSRGIILECDHVICYKCLSSGHCRECPLDRRELNYSQYYSWKYLTIPTCHATHEFNDQPIWRLPCFHYSCQDHLNLQTCYECGFDCRKWKEKIKESSYARSLLDFLKIKCLIHNLPITNIGSRPFALQCEKCLEMKGNLFGIHDLSVKPIEDLISDRLQMLQYDDVSNRKLENKALKMISNMGVRRLSEIFKAFCLVESLRSQCTSIATRPFYFFASSSCSNLGARNLFKSEKSFKVVLRFKCDIDLLCKGLILGYCYVPYKPPFHPLSVPPSRITYQKLLLSDNSCISSEIFNTFCSFPLKTTENLQKVEDFSNKARNLEFPSLIYLESNHVLHEFIIEMNPGHYFTTKAFSRLKLPDLELLKVKKTPEVISASLSSPLFGVLISKAVDI